MSYQRTIQIDVKGPEPANKSLVRCNIYFNGLCCEFWTTQYNYETLLRDGVFIRDGKEIDSAGVINTTNVFKEELDD